MHIAKRIALVLAAAAVGGLPGAIAIQIHVNAPVWYSALAALFGAVGIGLVGLVLGLLVLLAARGTPDQGIKAALLIAVLVSLVSSCSAYYGMQQTL